MSDSFALVYTVKNEERFLREGVRYHQLMGCQRVYVYLDGTSDGTAESLEGLQNVELFQTRKPLEGADLPSWITNLLHMWDGNMDVRKRINTFHAAELARRAGIDWLAAIDADEALILGPREDNCATIGEVLAGIPKSVDQVRMKNLECIPDGSPVGSPFRECTTFLNRFPATEVLTRYFRALVYKITRSPFLTAWSEHLLYKIRFGGLFPRVIIDPRDGKIIPSSYFLGYSNFKSMIRTTTHRNFNFNVHQWIAHTSAPKSVEKLNTLHYDMVDAAAYINKFSQRQESIILPVFYVRYHLAKIARDCSREVADLFFNSQISIVDSEKINRLEKVGIVQRIFSVSNTIDGDRLDE